MTDNGKDTHRELVEEFRKTHHKMPLWVLFLILLSCVLAIAYLASDLVVILLLSGVLAYMLNSAINKMQSFGLGRGVSVVLLYCALASILVFSELMLSPYLHQEIGNFYERLPEFSQQIEATVKQRTADPSKDYTWVEQAIRKVLSDAMLPGRLLNETLNLQEIFSLAAPFVLGLLLTPFFVFFLLKDWPVILKKIMKWIPPLYVETTVSALSEIDVLVGKYLRGLAVDCISVGAIAAVGLWLLGIHYPITLGILSGCANVIPYIGPIIACTVACLFAFIQFKSLGIVLNVALMYLAVKLADDLLIQPLTIGKALRLHPMLLVITIVTGEKIFGVIGMIVAVPIVTIAQKIVTIFLFDRRRPTAEKRTGEAGRIVV